MINLDVAKKNIKELCILYPKIKVPVEQYAEYYLAQMIRYNPSLAKHIHELEDLSKTEKSIHRYKTKTFEEVIKYLNQDLGIRKKIQEAVKENEYKDINNRNFKENKLYMSIDMNSAAWSVIKTFISDLRPGTTFDHFLKTKFGTHNFIADSKSFRQRISGNLSPTSIEKIQVVEMLELHKYLQESITDFHKYFMSRKPDEIILELPNDNEYLVMHLKEVIDTYNFMLLASKPTYSFKYSFFTFKHYQSYGDLVKVRTYIEEDKKDFFELPSDRFHLQLKKIMFNEEPTDYDKSFTLDNKIALWVL